MNIRLVNYTAYPFHGYGGAELYIYNYAKELIKNGHNVEIVCNSYDEGIAKHQQFSQINYVFIGKPFYGKYKKVLGNEVYIRKIYNKSRIASFLYRFSFWVGLIRYQLSAPSKFVHAFSDCGFVFTFFPKLALISTIFDIENRGLRKIGLWGIFIPIKKFYYSATTSRIVKKSMIVTSGGKDNTNELVDIFSCNQKKIKILANAINKESLQNFNHGDKGTLVQNINFVSVGRLEELKNPLLLLDTFKELLQKFNSYKYCLNIIGDGPLRDRVLEKIAIINKDYPNSISLKFNVSEEEKIKLLLASDLYINLAETRYMLLVVMEAMACSLPIFSRYPLDEVVQQNLNGVIYKSDNPQIIANEIFKCISSNDLKSMGDESLKIIRDFTWSNTAKQGEEMYSNLLFTQS
tara:strand:+ start:3351 stop:4568 length:1218 start_codon:yes stop_codon:yes gene_type:complete